MFEAIRTVGGKRGECHSIEQPTLCRYFFRADWICSILAQTSQINNLQPSNGLSTPWYAPAIITVQLIGTIGPQQRSMQTRADTITHKIADRYSVDGDRVRCRRKRSPYPNLAGVCWKQRSTGGYSTMKGFEPGAKNEEKMTTTRSTGPTSTVIDIRESRRYVVLKNTPRGVSDLVAVDQ